MSDFWKSEYNLLCLSTWQKLRYYQKLINPFDYGLDLHLYLEGTKLLGASPRVRSTPHWTTSSSVAACWEGTVIFWGFMLQLLEFGALPVRWTKDTVTIFKAPPCFLLPHTGWSRSVSLREAVLQEDHSGSVTFKSDYCGWKTVHFPKGKTKSRLRKCTCFWALLLLAGFMGMLLSCPHQLPSKRLVEVAVKDSSVERVTEGLVWQVHIYGSRL